VLQLNNSYEIYFINHKKKENIFMRAKYYLIVTILFFTISLQGKVYKVYFLGGQSNMDGYGFIKELPDKLNKPVSGVMIFHGNTSPDNTAVDGRGIWSELKPGHGAGFLSDGIVSKYSDRFGVELTFTNKLRELDPETNIAIIKYSRGGTSIDFDARGNFGCWEPDFNDSTDVNQYDHFLACLRYAFSEKDIDGDGEEDILIPAGIIWMQGESDSYFSAEIANRYEKNLKRLMDLIRAALRVDDLPVVIGRISDSGQDEEDGKIWDFSEIVREAQAAFVEKDECAVLITSTDNYNYSDPWHYDTEGFIDLGNKFAEAVYKLERK
jgi:hypothetical protein